MRILLAILPLLLVACCTTSRIQRYAQQQVLKDSALLTAHVGISVYEPATGKYLYNHQGDKYFVPASNTKLPTCYAAMKYLGDSLVGLRYQEYKNTVAVFPTADPTFLHPSFSRHPAFEFFKAANKVVLFRIDTINKIWREQHLGSGWAWNDYNEAYMAERSPMPIYGNLVNVQLLEDSFQFVDFMKNETNLVIEPKFFKKNFFEHRFEKDQNFYFKRSLQANQFEMEIARNSFKSQSIPFATNSIDITLSLLEDTIKDYLYDRMIQRMDQEARLKKTDYIQPDKQTFKPFYRVDLGDFEDSKDRTLPSKAIHSQPTDSLLRPMMHRSDNFFAEQSLLMVSNEHLQYMSDAAIIDTLLKTDFKNLPQKPRWADGSGLSRYNLFTPQDFVFILNKMKTDFGMARIKDILPTGGEGTLSSYYVSDSSFIYAKTGTLSGVVALSGFLYTQKGKELIFSILVNNHQGSATAVRRAVERFVKQLRKDL